MPGAVRDVSVASFGDFEGLRYKLGQVLSWWNGLSASFRMIKL
mgnify:CR=1 FL=1